MAVLLAAPRSPYAPLSLELARTTRFLMVDIFATSYKIIPRRIPSHHWHPTIQCGTLAKASKES